MNQQQTSELHPVSSVRPCSSVYSQDDSPFGDSFSLEDLAQKVDESTRISESNTISQLLSENEILCHEIAYHQREWSALMDLMHELMDTILLITGTLKDSNHKIAEAEEAWLAFWGIVKKSSYNNWM